MITEYKIEIGKHWLISEKQLMEKLSTIVSGAKRVIELQRKAEDPALERPYKKDSGYKWQLDDGNNYWAEIRGGELILAARYDQRLKELAAWLESRLQ